MNNVIWSIWSKELDTMTIIIGDCHQHQLNVPGSPHRGRPRSFTLTRPSHWEPALTEEEPGSIGVLLFGPHRTVLTHIFFANPSPNCCAIHHHDLGWTPKLSLRPKFQKSASRRWTVWWHWSIPWMWLAPKLVCQPRTTRTLNCFWTISF